ncbi:hypothetical protein DSO57_1012839 [Entomophthora muscae]|uniref:Uncharacterized protein n=1 Tax=Entomophthora muscae TaxID=34485 RepID=A0ACC2S7V5_9FUNG|nr:hypothetical protein DSO57_1012839 [Entomophthora muscae]
MELPHVVLWELFDFLGRGDLISLGSANKELRCIAAPVLFGRIHVDLNTIDYFKTNILNKYNKLCFSLAIAYSFSDRFSEDDVVLDALINVHCLTLQGFGMHRRNTLVLPELSSISRLSLYNSTSYLSMFKNLTSLFIFQNGGVKLDVLAVDCPLQKLSFNLIEVDLNFMEQVRILYPRLKLLNIFTRYDHGDFPIFCYDFKKNQTLGIGWKEDKSFFSLEFLPEDISETCMSSNETADALYMRLIGLLSKDKIEVMKLSLPCIKRFSLAQGIPNYSADYPFLILMQNAESICMGIRFLHRFPWRKMTYTTKNFFLHNICGRFHYDMFVSFEEGFKNLRVLCIHRFTDQCWNCFEFPQLLLFSAKFVSRHNVNIVIQGSPLLTTVYCNLGFNNCSNLMEIYPRIQIKKYDHSHLPYFRDSESMTSVFDQNA